MKKIFSILSLVSLALTGCLKDTAPNDFSTIQPILEMPYHGLSTFTKDAIVAAGQTDPLVVPFNINIASNYPLSTDVSYTTAIDDAKRVAYNLTVPTASQYLLLPDSCFSFGRKTGTIKAGTRLDTLYLNLFPSKIDPSKNYMLAISLKTATGITISGNFATAYFHIIGNPLAGNYNMTGTRYNYTGSVSWTGPPAAYPAGGTVAANYNAVILALPVDGFTVHFDMGNVPDPAGPLAQYYLTGDATFATITFNQGATFESGYSNIQRYVTQYTPPSPTVKPTFHLITKYNNTTGNAGNDRIIDQTFIHQ